MKEVWKDVVGYEDLYQVSNLGGVRAKDKAVYRSNGVVQHRKSKPLRPARNRTSPYLQVVLCRNTHRSTKKVHILVAEAFLDYKHSPSFDYQIDHVDGDPTNNSVNNLEVVTARENVSRRNMGNVSSKYTGVSYIKRDNKWAAHMSINKRSVFLGAFFNEVDAANKYNRVLDWVNGGGADNLTHGEVLKKSKII